MIAAEIMITIHRLKQFKINADHNIRRLKKKKSDGYLFWEKVSEKYQKDINELNKQLQ